MAKEHWKADMLLSRHRLEAGGFDSRLQARLMWIQRREDSYSPRFLEPSGWPADLGNQIEQDLLEIFAWKARDFGSKKLLH